MNYLPLSQVCQINMGQSPESSSYNENGDGLPFFQGNADFGERHPVTRVWCNAPTKIAYAGDILISVRAPIGAMNYASEECCIGRGLAAITPDATKVSSAFIFWLLKGKNTELNSKGTGSTFKAIGRRVLEEVLVPDIGLEQQAEYAQVLETVYALMEERKKQLRTLDQLIKARFVELFGNPYSNPRNWKQMTFKEASTRLSDGPFGSNLKSEHYSDTGVRVIRLGNIGVGTFIDDDKSFIPVEHYEKLKKYTCRSGEIVIGTLGDPNLRACIIPQDIGIAINKADCVHFIPKHDVLNATFACQYINCPETLLLAQGMIHGQTRARVSSGQIAEMPIFIPPMNLQNEFASFVSRVDKSKLSIQASLDQLETLKQSLMQKYFG